jgi:DNA-binding beta-propeller fold protein YncE
VFLLVVAVPAAAQPSVNAVRATVALNNNNAVGAQGIALDPATGYVYIAINGVIVAGCEGDSSARSGSPAYARKGENHMSIIDPSAAREVAVVATGRAPVWPTVDPIRRVVFVANSGSGTITIHDAATGRSTGTVTTGGKPHMGGLDLASRLMVVGNTVRSSDIITEQNHASIVDTANNRVTREFATGQAPHGVVVDQDRHLAYYTSVGDGVITVVNTETGQDLFSGTPRQAFGSAFGNNNMIARQAATRRLFQVNSQPNAAGVIVVDEVTLTAEGLIEFARYRPWGMWVDEPNRLLFAALPNANAIGVVDLDTLRHVASVPVGTCPYSVAVDPHRGVGVSSNAGSPTVNASASIFDLCAVYAATGRAVASCGS